MRRTGDRIDDCDVMTDLVLGDVNNPENPDPGAQGPTNFGNLESTYNQVKEALGINQDYYRRVGTNSFPIFLNLSKM